MTHLEYAAGLRAAAEFYENHAEIKMPHEMSVTNYSTHSKKDAADVLRAVGECQKDYSESQLTIKKEIAPGFFLRFVFSRERVCERVVVGTKIIPSHVLPARGETTVPERIEEMVEWRCGSILAPVIPAESEADRSAGPR